MGFIMYDVYILKTFLPVVIICLDFKMALAHGGDLSDFQQLSERRLDLNFLYSLLSCYIAY